VGVRNRQRRAAKKRARSRAGRAAPGPGRGPVGIDPVDLTRLQMGTAAGSAVDTGQDVAATLAGCAETFLTAGLLPAREAAVLAAGMAEEAVVLAWEHGWQPVDLAAVARRRLPAEHLPVVSALVRRITGRVPAARVDPRWSAQVDGLPDVPAVAERVDRLAGWAGSSEGMAACLAVIGLVRTLPVLPSTLPLPGRATGRGVGPRGVDGRVLAKIRALLAKAESTEFPEEAEALSTKAQTLMSRHSIDRLVVEADSADRPPIEGRRLWLDPPYVLAKAHLVDAVAGANRCRAVCSDRIGFVTVFGDVRDLDTVDLLTTSLLVQASRAMLAHGPQTDRHGRSRSRSFRQSFLLSYAARIAERLGDAAGGVVSAHAEPARLLPVLRSHDRRVADAMAETYPEVVTRGASVSDGAGWVAGRAAADGALFDIHERLAEPAG